MVIILRDDLKMDVPDVRSNFPAVRLSLPGGAALTAIRFDYLSYEDRRRISSHLTPEELKRVFFFFLRGHLVVLPSELFRAPKFYQGAYNL